MLRGKTIGLVGVGSIGAHLASTAKHFGMRVHGYTRSSRSSADVDQYFHGGEKAAFASGLDYLVAVLPDTQETRGIIDRTMIGALPPRALLINAGRGAALEFVFTYLLLHEKRVLTRLDSPAPFSTSLSRSRCRTATRSGARPTSSSPRIRPRPACRSMPSASSWTTIDDSWPVNRSVIAWISKGVTEVGAVGSATSCGARYVDGRMFEFRRRTFDGSYFRFNAARRARLLPNAATDVSASSALW
jgi:hypothetical protein